MGKRRSKSSIGSLSQPLGGVTGARSNVIDLSLHRWRRARVPSASHTVYYIHESGEWQNLLTSFPFLSIQSIENEEVLRARLIHCPPDLILIDSQLRWADLVHLTAFLHNLVQVPIVMICGAPPSSKASKILKQAYAVGLHDAVFAPLQREELFESLEVLLKFRRQVSLPTP